MDTPLICKLLASDSGAILDVINDAAESYRNVIPKDRWKEPYMEREELKTEIAEGVNFYGWIENDRLVGVMGIQPIRHVTLIRHAYVLTSQQRSGIGTKLLKYLLSLARTQTVLVGTWEAAWWAVRFYQKHGFELVSVKEKNGLLREYWNIPERQTETSVVLKLFQKHS